MFRLTPARPKCLLDQQVVPPCNYTTQWLFKRIEALGQGLVDLHAKTLICSPIGPERPKQHAAGSLSRVSSALPQIQAWSSSARIYFGGNLFLWGYKKAPGD